MDGFKHGKGKMNYPSQNFYEGDWKLDKKEGYGIMNWVNTKEKVSIKKKKLYLILSKLI